MQEVQFSNGVRIPMLGFGTAAIGVFQRNDHYVKGVIANAIKTGYRHIDTASVYGNERSVGQAIRESGLARKQFFITSKVWDSEQGYDETLRAFDRSLRRLDTDYLDLYLVHWPWPDKTPDTWRALEKLYADKRVRAIGLSNFRQQDIEQILSFAQHKPVYNQIELHPYLTQKSLTEYCRQQEIAVACWSPLGSGSWSGASTAEKPLTDQTIAAIAEQHKASTAQVILQWNIQQQRIVIPKSETPEHIANNFKAGFFTLSAEEIKAIDALNKGKRFGGDPDNAYLSNVRVRVPD